MRNLKKKFLEGWSTGAAVIGVVGATTYIGATQGMGLIHAISAGLTNSDKLGVTLAALNTALLTTVSMFALARWSALSDCIENHSDAIREVKEELDEVKRQNGQLQKVIETTVERDLAASDQLSSLSESIADLRRAVRGKDDPMIDDDDSVWAGIVYRLISLNPTFARELSISQVAGGRFRITAEPTRVFGNFLARLLQPGMRLIYVVYIPKELGFGENPGEILLKLVHIIRCARKRAAESGKKLQATINVFVVDRPRPIGSVFLGYRRVDGRLEPYVLEYFRSLTPGAIGTPTCHRGLLQHTSERRVRELYEHVESEVKVAVEIGYRTLERVISPLLPREDGGIAPAISPERWRAAIRDLYELGEGSSTEVVDTGSGSFRLDERSPSIYSSRGLDADILSESPLETPAANEKSG